MLSDTIFFDERIKSAFFSYLAASCNFSSKFKMIFFFFCFIARHSFLIRLESLVLSTSRRPRSLMIVIRSPATHGPPCDCLLFWHLRQRHAVTFLICYRQNNTLPFVFGRGQLNCCTKGNLMFEGKWQLINRRLSNVADIKLSFILKRKPKWMWNASHARPVVKFAKARRNLFLLSIQ